MIANVVIKSLLLIPWSLVILKTKSLTVFLTLRIFPTMYVMCCVSMHGADIWPACRGLANKVCSRSDPSKVGIDYLAS